MGCFCFCKPNAIGPFGRCLGSHLTDGGPIRRLSGSNTFLKCTRTAGEVSRSLFFSFIETQCTRGGKNKNTAGCVPRCIGTSGVMKRGTLSAPISSLSGDTAEGSRGKTHPQGEKATMRIGKAEREELFCFFFRLEIQSIQRPRNGAGVLCATGNRYARGDTMGRVRGQPLKSEQ